MAVSVLPFSCALEETTPATETNLSGNVTLTGGFLQTKTSYGDSSNGYYELLWSEDDAIGIFSYDMTTTNNFNVSATIYAETVGQSAGKFLPDSDIELPTSGSEKFLIYYPYDSSVDLDVDDGCIYSNLSASQTQDKVSDKEVGKNGFSYGMSTVSADDGDIDFTLEHTMSYLRFVATTTEYTDYQLYSIQLSDLNEEVTLVGDYVFDPQTGLSTANSSGTTSSSASVTVANTDFTQDSSSQELYLTVLPGDYSSANFQLLVTYMASDSSTVVIPIDFDVDLVLNPASMYTVTLSGLSSDSGYEWYASEDSRDFVDDGWCYGAQNTYYIEQKASGTSTLSFEVKARGKLSKVRKPVYYGWVINSNVDGLGLLSFSDGTTDGYKTIGDDYTVTVQCADQTEDTGDWGVLAIYDEDYNTLWSFMIAKYLTGDEVGSVYYSTLGLSLMDRQLGYPESIATSIANGVGKTHGTALFQWGRPTPLPYDNVDDKYTKVSASEEYDLEYGLTHPTVMPVSNSSSGVTKYDWKYNNGKDPTDLLWGGEKDAYAASSSYDTSIRGTKTIYDPCPEGYRVCDGVFLNEIVENGRLMETADWYTNENYKTNYSSNESGATDSPLSNHSLYRLDTDGNGTYDYWLFTGVHWHSSTAWTNAFTQMYRTFGYWGCSTSSVGYGICRSLFYYSTVAQYQYHYHRSCALGVRCQKED